MMQQKLSRMDSFAFYASYAVLAFGVLFLLYIVHINSQWLLFGLILVMAVALVVSLRLFIQFKQQKRYYQKIIDISTNIIIISDTNEIINANKAFFNYFHPYTSIEDFKAEHTCLCDFFVEQTGYLQKDMHGINWLDYVMENDDMNHMAKLQIGSDIYYFLIVASLVSEELNHYAITLSDITEQEIYKEELEKLTITDPLTGIGNRRYYEQRVEEEISRTVRYDNPLSIILFDIDYFKKVNDLHGHDMGDKVLVTYSGLIRSILREMDEFCRIGGEEFIIIAPHIDKNEAQLLAQKLRKAVENHQSIVPITMSFGVTQYCKGESKDELFKRADEALYRAKKEGRNRVVVI